jgi:NifB/MoaA-like Fe-S oxidoreductase
LSRKRGITSFAKSTFEGVCAANLPENNDKTNATQTNPDLANLGPRLTGNFPVGLPQGNRKFIGFIFKITYFELSGPTFLANLEL